MDKFQDILLEEILDHYIIETYQSISEIKNLASDVIKKIAENNMQRVKDGEKITYLYGIYLNEIDSSKYDEIKDFIDESNIAISINDKWSHNPKGSYSVIMSKDKHEFNPKSGREIDIYVDKIVELYSKINKKIEENPDYNEQDLYFDLFYEVYDALIHELQHAYDDFRSKNKVYQSKQFNKYREKYMQGVEDNIDQEAKKFVKYLNLPHEIWARFSQAMYRVSFVTWDRERSKEDFLFKMKPIKDVVREFKYEFNGFKLLSDKMKRKLINKVVQFWHYEAEKLKKENKNKK